MRAAVPALLTAAAVLALPAVAAAQPRTILHNRNNYPVWVAIGTLHPGGEQFDGGPIDPPAVQSKGWYKVAANDAVEIRENFTHVHARAYSLTAKRVFQVRPEGPGQPYNFFYKLDNFTQDRMFVTNTFAQTVAAKGGELQPFYPLAAYKNPQQNRYEISGPMIQGGEPPQALPPAATTVRFTNGTDATVFFTVTTNGKSTNFKLKAGEMSGQIPIQLTTPAATVNITQNDGTQLSFTLPEGKDYVFKKENGKIKNFYK